MFTLMPTTTTLPLGLLPPAPPIAPDRDELSHEDIERLLRLLAELRREDAA